MGKITSAMSSLIIWLVAKLHYRENVTKSEAEGPISTNGRFHRFVQNVNP
jgi:hypothetical protein